MINLFYNSGDRIVMGDTVQYTIGYSGEVVGLGPDVGLSSSEILVSSQEFGMISIEVDDKELVLVARKGP